MTIKRLISVFLIISVVWACSVIDDESNVPKPGLQPDGSFLLTHEEYYRSCARLTGAAMVKAEEMKVLARQEKEAQEAMPKSMLSLIARRLGYKGVERTLKLQYQRRNAVVAALNQALLAKGCDTFDPIEIVGPNAALMN